MNKNETYLESIEELLKSCHLLWVPSMLKMESGSLVLLNKINVGFLDFFDDIEVRNFLFPAFEVAIPGIKFSFGDLLPRLIIFFHSKCQSERVDFG